MNATITASDVARMSASEKRELLRRLLRERRQAAIEYPLSHNQRAMWFLSRLAPDAHAYNVVFSARIEPGVDSDRLRRALDRLVARHASLRTTVVLRDGEPFQRDGETTPDFEVRDARGWTEAGLESALAAEARRPFELERDPPFRTRLFELQDGSQILHCVFHHIAFDAASFPVFLGDLRALYEAEETGRSAGLAPSAATYGEFVEAQLRAMQGAEGERLWNYWRGRLREPLPVLDLPTDRPRGSDECFEGDSVPFRLEPELTSGIAALGRTVGATPYVVLCTALQCLLHRWTGATDIMVGAPVTCRTDARFSAVIGDFVNLVVLRGEVRADASFIECVRQARARVLEALDHREFPFPLLVQRLQVRRMPGRNPLVDVLFNLVKAPGKGLAEFFVGSGGEGGLPFGKSVLRPHSVRQQEGQTDLAVIATEVGGAITGDFKFRRDLFERATVEWLVRAYEALLRHAVENPSERIGALRWEDPPEGGRQEASAEERVEVEF